MPPVPAEEANWLRLVDKTLAGRPFESLIARSDDGLNLRPLFPRSEAGPLAARAAGRAWKVIQRIDHPDPATAKAQALDDLGNGADGLALVFRGAPAAHGFGIDDLRTTLDGVPLENRALRIEAAPYGTRMIANDLAAILEERGVAAETAEVSFGFDPLGDLAFSGKELPDAWDIIAGRLSDAAKTFGARGYRSPVLRADGRVYHAGGASEAQELAAVLATALAYLRALEDGGIPIEEGLARIGLMLAADCDQILTVAKLRAQRLLWARFAEEVGVPGAPVRIDVETAWRDLSRRDPWTNLLRATIATASTGVAGADAITVLPFTQALGLPDGFARRLARNTHLILMEESNLHRIADPAAGSGTFETLTAELAEKAWDLFRDIERRGGMLAALRSGHIQGMIAATCTERLSEIATRKRALVGTSVFPHLGEQPVSVIESLPDSQNGETLAIPAHRLGEAFEVLRDHADAFKARTGERPRLFLVNLGRASEWGPRAAFARGFFEAGGIAAIDEGGFETYETAAEAFRTSRADIACLCASDEAYGTLVEPAARALKAAGARLVHVAGRPPADDSAWRDAGVDSCVYSGRDAVTALTEIQTKLGIA